MVPSSELIVCALIGITIVLIAYAAFRPAVTQSSREKMPDAELTEIIAKGKNKMPGYEKSLKPDEIEGQVAYIHSLAPKKNNTMRGDGGMASCVFMQELR